MSTLAFDTHAFIKAFINAKTEEEKAEILAKTIAETREEGVLKIEKKFDKAKDELVTKKDLDVAINVLKIEMLKWMFGMLAGQLTLIVIILKFFFKGAGGI